MEGRQIDLSVIIPTFNEAKNIPVLLEKLRLVLDGISHEIIVVDDNSPDRTWEIAENLADKYNVRVIRRLNEKGLSSAALLGMASAHGRVFTVMDADLQHDEQIIPRMHQEVMAGEADICIGSRAVAGGSYGGWSKRRRFISYVATLLARLVLHHEISDPMSGFFTISRECFEATAEKINPRGFKILLEFIGRRGDIKIQEIGYTFRNRLHGETKLSAGVIRNYLVALYDIWFGKYVPSTFLMYSVVGVTGVIVNLIGFQVGDMMGLPRLITGISILIDPIYTAAPFGYQLAIFSNYFLNNYVTFYEKRRRGAAALFRGFLLFELISLFGLFIHTGIFQLVHINGLFQGIVPEWSRALVNNGFGLIVALVSNYYLNLNFTWGDEDKNRR